MLIDARRVSDGAEYRFDLVIVGAGPAGILIAERLRGAGLSIALLDSGGFEPSVRAQRLNRGENVGHPYLPLQTSRMRMFGGAANRWGGLCRALDPRDFDERSWVPYSGWPITGAELAPYHEAAARALRLPRASFSVEDWPRLDGEPLPLDGTGIEQSLIQYSPATNFGDEHRERVLAQTGLSLFLHATVTDLPLDPWTDRVGAVKVRASRERAFTVRGTAVVLAAGAIENARLLLAARGDRPAGLGNEHDQVGRYFMEHLHLPAGHVLAAPAAADRSFYALQRRDGVEVRGVLTPGADLQKQLGLLGCSMVLEPPVYPHGQPFLQARPELTVLPERAFRAIRRRGMAGEAVREAARRVAAAGWYGRRSGAARRTARTALEQAPALGVADVTVHSLYLRAEQAPDPSSRVRLTSRLDPLGLPEVALDWRISALDTDSISGWLGQLDEVLAGRRLGRVLPLEDGWPQRLTGGPHQMGTTRMSADPRAGVVDADGRVHSVANLYVTGSSVFTTGGHANPTFSLLALSLRLADHLGTVLR